MLKKIFEYEKLEWVLKQNYCQTFQYQASSLVIESFKFAKKVKIDWKHFYDLSSLGSGSSKSLDRIAPQAINNNHDIYLFTIKNSIKDMRYMFKLSDVNDDMIKITKSFLNHIYRNKKTWT